MSSTRDPKREPDVDPELDPEATVTFGGARRSDGPQVEISDAEQIEEIVLGAARPRSFEERYPSSGVIGEGGMGKIHLAQDRILMRDVAIKVLRAEGRPDPIVLRRFLREAQVTAQLNHPNVVPLYGLESTGRGSPAFVMKLIEGITFKEYVESCRRAWGTPRWDHDTHGLKTRIEHFVKACDAIAYSHERGVIHRDLKPANVMLGDHNVVYVMDWGIARVVGETFEDELSGEMRLSEADLPDTGTRTGDVIGTPMFMSPEQATLESAKLTSASDQYSLGLMLQNLVTGCPPRDAENVIEAIQMAQRGERASFPDEGPGGEAPREVRAIIAKATRQNPALRYPSVAELATDLRRFLHGEEVRALPDNFVRAAWRRIHSQPLKAMSALLAIVLIAASTNIWSLQSKLAVEEEAARHQERLKNLYAVMTKHLEDTDRRLAGTEVIVKALAVRAEEILAGEPAGESRWFAPEELNTPTAPPDTGTLDRYTHVVSFARAAHVLAPRVDRADVAEVVAHTNALEDALRETFFLTLKRVYEDKENPADWSPERAVELLREEAKAQYAYLGFENGLMLNFPAINFFPENYDPRLRPWYVPCRDLHAPRWGSTYPDASGSGLLLPCNVTIRGRGGEVLGVAGLDVSVETARNALNLDLVDNELKINLDQERIHDAFLVDGEGRILFSANDPKVLPPAGLHGNRAADLDPLGVPEVEESIRNGHPVGSHEDGDGNLYVFARLRTLDWTLVLVLDEDIDSD